MQPDLRCYHHPERAAVNQCDRCGDYLCDGCVHEHYGDSLCARCLADLTRPVAESEATVAAVLNLTAAGMAAFLAPAVAYATREPEAAVLVWLLSGAMLIAALVFCLMAWNTTERRARWLVAAVGLSWVAPLLLCGVACAMVAAMTMWISPSQGRLLEIAFWVVQAPIAVAVVASAGTWAMAVRAGTRPLKTIILSAVLIAGELLYVLWLVIAVVNSVLR